MKSQYQNDMEKIKEMIECPYLYLIDYFDLVKSKVDADFELTLQTIQDEHLRDEKIKKWIKIVEVIDKCFDKCSANRLKGETLNQVKEKLIKIKSNETANAKENLEAELTRIRDNLENHLLENDSYAVILVNTNTENGKSCYENPNSHLVLVIEEELNQSEIAILKDMLREKNQVFPDYEVLRDQRVNYIKTKCIFNKIYLWHNWDENIIFISASLQNVTDLNLNDFFYRSDSVSLLPDTFKVFTNLTKLRFVLSIEINQECFRSLTNLKELDLSYSLIRTLSDDAFFGLTSLEILDLSFVPLKNLKRTYFKSMKKLKELYLSCCSINKLDENVFFDLENLEFLDLTANVGVVLKLNCFNGLKKLKRLCLDFCNVKPLKNNFFAQLENLEVVELSGNFLCFKKSIMNDLGNLRKQISACFKCAKSTQFGNLNFNQVIGLNALRRLDLSDCNLKSLKKDTFTKLVNLETLDLKKNQKIILNSGCFNGLTKLKALDLSICGITKLREDSFASLNCLELINLNENYNIQLGLKVFENFKATLKYLLLGDCNLKILSRDFFNGFDNLESIDLSCNRDLFFEEGCFNGLNSLKELNLSLCGINGLEENRFDGMSSLEVLYFYNCISKMDLNSHFFDGLHNLKHLNLPDTTNFFNKKEESINLNDQNTIDVKKDHEQLLSLGLDYLGGLDKLKCITFGYKHRANMIYSNNIYGLRLLKAKKFKYFYIW